MIALPERLQARLSTPAGGQRYWEVDALRGVAILMMVLYHCLYDLAEFGGHDIRVRSGFWDGFADATAFLFIFLAGVSLSISYARMRGCQPSPVSSGFPKFARRGARIFAYGLLVSVATWVVDPEHYVRFGVLHLIGASIILAYPLLGRAVPAAVLGLVLVAAGVALEVVRYPLGYPWLLWVGFRPDHLPVFDYRPLLPWFGVVLLGVALGQWLYPQARRVVELPDLSRFAPITFLGLLGRRSLAIYLVHQPLLLGVLALLGAIEL
ncbi:heparan-alpha-glucosaminide N-acetyltransferase [Sphaerobacter thermophilus]|uniref:heparan-alpha-glucosaminide N-acetyltransferase n=1 Tax=Sphaerobacter thermophilus TaxID=2057 RepID=UPI0001A35750|nr:heparan-alpha-glucosaminide N-acetyltransferase [Sphaerobacter thermophilus]